MAAKTITPKTARTLTLALTDAEAATLAQALHMLRYEALDMDMADRASALKDRVNVLRDPAAAEEARATAAEEAFADACAADAERAEHAAEDYAAADRLAEEVARAAVITAANVDDADPDADYFLIYVPTSHRVALMSGADIAAQFDRAGDPSGLRFERAA